MITRPKDQVAPELPPSAWRGQKCRKCHIVRSYNNLSILHENRDNISNHYTQSVLIRNAAKSH